MPGSGGAVEPPDRAARARPARRAGAAARLRRRLRGHPAAAGHRRHRGRLLRRRHGAGQRPGSDELELRGHARRAVHQGLDRQPAAARRRHRRPGVLPGRRGGRPAGPAAAPDDPTRRARWPGIYDDMVHVVTPAGVTDPHARASCAGPGSRSATRDSGVYFIARRLLEAAGAGRRTGHAGGAAGHRRVVRRRWPTGSIDAFFWSGALPTQGVTALAAQLPIRLLDLADVVGPMRAAHPEYAPGHGARRQLRHPGAGDQPAGAQRAAGRRRTCPTTWPRR